MDVEYPRNLHKLHSDLPFLPEKMKINNCTKIACNLNDKGNYPVHVLALKKVLNHRLKLKKYIEELNLDKKHGWNLILIWIQN